MNGEGFAVDTDAMRAHAERLSRVGNRLGTAADASQQTTLSSGAFGLLGQFLAMQTIALEGVMTGIVAAAEASANGVAGGVRCMAETYDEVEQLVEELFRAIQGNR